MLVVPVAMRVTTAVRDPLAATVAAVGVLLVQVSGAVVLLDPSLFVTVAVSVTVGLFAVRVGDVGVTPTLCT